jgi:hypothetical protein
VGSADGCVAGFWQVAACSKSETNYVLSVVSQHVMQLPDDTVVLRPGQAAVQLTAPAPCRPTAP